MRHPLEILSETTDAIDDFTIRKFEQFSHWTQRLIGVKTTDWERICLVLSIVFYFHFGLKVYGFTGGMIIWQFFMQLIFAIQLLGTFLLPKRTQRNDQTITMNPLKIINKKIRFFCLFIGTVCLPIDIYRFVTSGEMYHFWYQTYLCAMYFQTCDDLPWQKSKLLELVTSIRAGLMQQQPIKTE